MSRIEMASNNKLSYQRLISNGEFYAEKEEGVEEEVIERKRSWSKFRRVFSKRRSKLRIPGLRRFIRRKDRFFSSVRIKWCKVWKRLKESKSHMGDLFAGNYLVMQVSPSSFKSIQNKTFRGHDEYYLPSTEKRIDDGKLNVY